MKNRVILEELEILRQISKEMNDSLPEEFLSLQVKNRLPEIILKLQMLSMNINNQSEQDMKNEMNKIDYCKHCEKPIILYPQAGFWYHETKNGTHKLCEDGNNLAEPKEKAFQMRNEMPKTNEEWFGAIGKKVQVYAEIKARPSLEVFAMLKMSEPDDKKLEQILTGKVIIRGEIFSVNMKTAEYRLQVGGGAYRDIDIRMDKTEAFEFITEKEKNIPEPKSEVSDISQQG